MDLKPLKTRPTIYRNNSNEIMGCFHFKPCKDASRLPVQDDHVNCGMFALYFTMCRAFGKAPNPKFDTHVANTLRQAIGFFFIRAGYLSKPEGSDESWIEALTKNATTASSVERLAVDERRQKQILQHDIHQMGYKDPKAGLSPKKKSPKKSPPKTKPSSLVCKRNLFHIQEHAWLDPEKNTSMGEE